MNEGVNKAALRFTWTELAAILALFAVSVAIRGYSLGTMAANPDELIYGSRAAEILGANWTWPKAFMLDQPPLFEYLLAVVMVSFGGSLEALRWISVLAGSATVVVTYLLGRSIFGRTAGAISAFVLMVNGFDIYYSRVIYIESVAILLIMTSVLLFWKGAVAGNSLRLTVLGGVIFGLALDTKYITLVVPIALALFLVLSKMKRLNTPFRLTGVFLLSGLVAFLPVLLDLAISDRNPFFWLLDSRFLKTNAASTLSQLGTTGGGLVTSGFQAFVADFTHVSSLNPFAVFPDYSLYVLLWEALIGITVLAFLVSFLVRRRPADAYLLLFFAGFLAFALLYPDKRYYFFLYPVVPLAVMFGGLVAGALGRLGSSFRERKNLKVALAAAVIIGLSISGVAASATAFPATYSYGFGDWDEIAPIMTYVQAHATPGAYVATTLPLAYYYGVLHGVNVQFIPILRPVPLSTLPASEHVLDTPLKTGFPIAWVISPVTIQTLHPQFIIMSKAHYDETTIAFHQLLAEDYYQPLSTNLILLFVMDPGASNSTSSGP